jgi:hypothetical protein
VIFKNLALFIINFGTAELKIVPIQKYYKKQIEKKLKVFNC